MSFSYMDSLFSYSRWGGVRTEEVKHYPMHSGCGGTLSRLKVWQFNLPERCTVTTVVMMPGITDQTQWGWLNKLPAHSSASAVRQRGTESTNWREHQPRMKKSIHCFLLHTAHIFTATSLNRILNTLKISDLRKYFLIEWWTEWAMSNKQDTGIAFRDYFHGDI